DSSALIGIQDQTKKVGLQYFNGDETGLWFTCYNNLPHSGLAVKFKETVQIEHNLLVFKWPLDEDFRGNPYYDPYLVYYIKEVGDQFDNNTVKVFNIGQYAESNFSVFSVISIKDSLGNSQTIDSTSVLVSTPLLPYDSCEVAFSTGWQPEARGFYLVTYRVELPTDQFPSDDTTCGLLMAEKTKFTAGWASTVPNCDGIIGPAEWDDATKFDISRFAMPSGFFFGGEHYYDSSACFAYVKNDSDYVYFAFDVPKDTHDTHLDNASLYIDDNGDSWFEADSSEGNFKIFNRIDAATDSLYFEAHVSTAGCWTQRIWIEHDITDWEFAITNNNGRQQFEIAIPRGTDPKWELNFIPGDSIGVSLLYYDTADSHLYYDGNCVGYWPATSLLSYNPCKMGKIYLSEYTDVEDISEEEDIPKKYALFQNYPNPFNPQTSIQFDLPKDTEVRLTIYNILGQKVKTLVDERLRAGHKQVLWDGKNEKGKEVSSGIYFYRIQAGDFSETKKMTIIK
ncbi:MAG: T9SS type A sorting domain-containing protein, partial [Candidatus Zixiibacteriota bacterium]